MSTGHRGDYGNAIMQKWEFLLDRTIRRTALPKSADPEHAAAALACPFV